MKSLLVFGGWVFCLVLVFPLLAPHDPMTTAADQQLSPPSAIHLLGTDLLGRDILSRLLVGGRRTVVFALAASAGGFLAGTISGLGLAFLRGVREQAAASVMAGLLAIPQFVLALCIIAAFGNTEPVLILALGLVQVPSCALIVRDIVRRVLAEPYFESARAVGVGWWDMTRRYIVPNALESLLAYAVVMFSYSLMNGAALAFLGIGTPPGTPDWGVMLYEARLAFRSAPWTAAASGLAIAVTIFMARRAARALDGQINTR